MTQTTRSLALVDAFTDQPLRGNAAGVVESADGLTGEQMQQVASELQVSETAFVQSSGSADRRIRYFTPTTEVDLCGHATIAAHARLHSEGRISDGSHTVETNVATIAVEVHPSGLVWMEQDTPDIRSVEVEIETVSAALGLESSAVMTELPLARASTGVPFLIVPIRYLDNLGAITAESEAILEVAELAEAVGIYAFTFDTLESESTLHGRAFVPGLGIEEDPVTGTASGAVGAYLRRYEAFESMPDELRFEQGHYVDRPGIVRVSVDGEIRVGGNAVTAVDGEITIPEADSDDIIVA